MPIRTILLLSAFVLSLSGCGSSPPVTFYGLVPLAEPSGSASAQIVIEIGPLSFPEYLRRPQIVTTESSGEITLAEFDRWAEPLTNAFRRTLTMNLDSLLEDVIAIQFPVGAAAANVNYRVSGQVSRFDVDSAGTATLDVSWSITGSADQMIVPVTRSVFRATAASVADYGQVVKALNETLEAFSREVAQQFTSVRTR